MKPFVFKIGGQAGFGIASSGLTFDKIATRSGYYIFDYLEYPSLIRGGHNIVETIVSDKPVLAPYQHTDFLIAFGQETIDRHHKELLPGSFVMVDSDGRFNLEKISSRHHLIKIPLNKIAREVGDSMLMRDTVALGATMFLLKGDLTILFQLIEQEFKKKGDEVVQKNQAVAKAGYEYVAKEYAGKQRAVLAPKNEVLRQSVITGNEAVALGAIAAGMQFAAIYPMTPTSNILHVLAPLQEQFGFVYKQPEDEISAINMAIGAAFAGARSMVATAGGGFCLMAEGYGLSGMTETPVVIIEGMRGAPATGLPTWTEQGDLRFMLHAGQGDFPRIVIAPGDAEEAFHATMEAFNLAEKYQSPVVIMIDKHLCESHQSFPLFNYGSYKINRGKLITKKQKNYERYALSADGISPRSIAGVGNHIVANSDEHTTVGFSSEEIDVREAQMEKRMHKMATCAKEDMAAPKLYGPKDAKLTIVGWGSSKGAILEALKELPGVNFLHLTWLSPFPTEAVKKILNKAKKILTIELNYTGQLAGLIQEKTGIILPHQFLKYNGRPLYPEEVIFQAKHLL